MWVNVFQATTHKETSDFMDSSPLLIYSRGVWNRF